MSKNDNLLMSYYYFFNLLLSIFLIFDIKFDIA
jgi:hypothetical protein